MLQTNNRQFNELLIPALTRIADQQTSVAVKRCSCWCYHLFVDNSRISTLSICNKAISLSTYLTIDFPVCTHSNRNGLIMSIRTQLFVGINVHVCLYVHYVGFPFTVARSTNRRCGRRICGKTPSQSGINILTLVAADTPRHVIINCKHLI